VPDSLDFFLSGRSLPGLVTGLAFISANEGAVGPAVDSCRAGKLVGPVLWAAEADSGAGVNALTIGEAPGGFREKVALGGPLPQDKRLSLSVTTSLSSGMSLSVDSDRSTC
jgi:hypothetical protein